VVETLNVGSLFSGIGGLDHGLARAGFEHSFLCEVDAWRRTVLAARFPGVPIYEDVRAVLDTGDELRRVWDPAFGERERVGGSPIGLLAGGFPCTDLSVAGRRAGIEQGEHSSLFFEFARIAESLRPRWLLIENVPGLFSSPARDSGGGADRRGADFGIVLGTLADIGYSVAWRTLNSRFFGVPQRRRRVFIVGTDCGGDPRAAGERAGQVLGVGTRCARHSRTRITSGATDPFADPDGSDEDGWDDGDGPDGDPDQASAYYVEGAPNGALRANGADGGRFDKHPVVTSALQGGTAGGMRMDADSLEQLIPAVTRKWAKGSGGPAGDETQNLVTFIAEPEREQGTDIVLRESELSPALGTSRNDRGLKIAAISENQRGEIRERPVVDPLAGQGGKPGQGYAAVREDLSVRRLTPRECERLQGLPDDWTNPDGAAADTNRYAGVGDAVTAYVAEWIGSRILAA
jgi:DNA (cytosine-5)-methyltransferase 1